MTHAGHCPPSPPTLAGFDMDGVIGAGGSGTVFLAHRIDTGEPVAVKVVDHGWPTDAPDRTALVALAHPGVVGVIEIVLGRPALLVMELACSSLADTVSLHGPVDAGRAVAVAADVCAALAHLHGRGWVHGDVTPANVLLTPDGRAVLADLDSCRRADNGPVTHGTPGYVPEDARRDAAVDLDALAATIAHACTGQPPPARDPYWARRALVDLPELTTALLDTSSAAAAAARLGPADPIRVTGLDRVPRRRVDDRAVTRPFGPGPPPGSPRQARPVRRRLPARAAILAAAALAAAALAALTTGSGPRSEVQPQQVVVRLTPDDQPGPAVGDEDDGRAGDLVVVRPQAVPVGSGHRRAQHVTDRQIIGHLAVANEQVTGLTVLSDEGDAVGSGLADGPGEEGLVPAAVEHGAGIVAHATVDGDIGADAG